MPGRPVTRPAITALSGATADPPDGPLLAGQSALGRGSRPRRVVSTGDCGRGAQVPCAVVVAVAVPALGDLGLAQAFGEEGKHLGFAGGEPAGWLLAGAGWAAGAGWLMTAATRRSWMTGRDGSGRRGPRGSRLRSARRLRPW